MKQQNIPFLIILFFYLPISAQEESISQKIDEIESVVYSHSWDLALQKADSLLHIGKLTTQNILKLKTIKVEALVQTERFERALLLSNEILEHPGLRDEERNRILIERALLFEITSNYPESLLALNKVKEYYKKQGDKIKDELYGEYLYRLSSWYRMQGYYDEARLYAQQANIYGEKFNYTNVIATANLLLAFTEGDQTSVQKFKYLQKAINKYEEFGDMREAFAASFGHANWYFKRGEYKAALHYLDSIKTRYKKDIPFHFIPTIAKLKSEIFEKSGQLDSALIYHKKFKEFSDEQIFNSQSIKINEIKYGYELEKEKLQNTLLQQNLSQQKDQNRALLIATVILLVLISVVGVLLFSLSRRNKSIAKQSKEISETNRTLNITISEKQLMLKELNHRVKNNLALIISLIKFHTQDIDEQFYKDKFQHLEKRINAIVMAHEQFIYSENKKEGGFYNLEEYIQKIAASLIQATNKHIEYTQKIIETQVSIDTALPIGILCNELISNSIKHASVAANDIKINLSIREENGIIRILYHDNGKTFISEKEPKSLGLFIIESMVSQLNGSYKREGAYYKIELSIK